MSQISGTRRGDNLAGTDGDDTIHGLGGADTILGGLGDDRLYGDDGKDSLNGGAGDDALFGGVARDQLQDDAGGADTLMGESGNDVIRIERDFDQPAAPIVADGGYGFDKIAFDFGALDGRFEGAVSLDGSFGDDIIRVYQAQTITMTGGAGDDKIGGSDLGDIDITGDDGNDTIVVDGAEGGQISAGKGDDGVRVGGLTGAVSVKLGTGANLLLTDDQSLSHVLLSLVDGHNTIIVQAAQAHAVVGTLSVDGFAAGDSGDVLNVGAYLGVAAPTWDQTVDPFAAGYLRLEATADGGAELQIDVDGPAAKSGWAALVEFHDSDPAGFTAANFAGFDPHAGPNGMVV